MRLGTFNGIGESFIGNKPCVYLDACGCCMWSKMLEDCTLEELSELLSEIERQKSVVVKAMEAKQ